MSEGRHDRPAEGRPEHEPGGGPRSHPQPSDERPGTSWGAANEHQANGQHRDGQHPDGQHPGPDDAALDPEAEESLRQLLHGVADRVEPDPAALEHIRHAIPVRRARRRNALIGAGAAALAVGVTLPLMQAGVVPGPLNNDRPSNAAHSQQTDSEGRHDDDTVSGGQGERDSDTERNSGGSGDEDKDDASSTPSHSDSASPGDDELSSTAPTCSRAQLGDADVAVGDPDARGRVYGSFQLSNVSDETCRVRGGDGLTASGQGRTPDSGVQVLEHTSGGKASALPDPSEARGPVILRPGEAYEVKFAFLPSAERGRCVPEDPDPTEPPDDGGDDNGGGNEGVDGGGGDGGEGDTGDNNGNEGGDGGDGGESGMSALSNGGGGEAEPSSAVVLNYTPAAGHPQLPTAYVKSSCAGTIYRTGPLNAS